MSLDKKFNARMKLVEAAIDLHGSYLRQYLRNLTKQSPDADELFDDLFLFALRRFKESDITNLGLLRRKAYQLFVDWWRKQRRSRIVSVEELPESPTDFSGYDAYTAEEEAEFKIRFFDEYQAELSDEQKDLLWLHARLGMTHIEIGKELNLPASTVGDRLQAARKVFAEYLQNG